MVGCNYFNILKRRSKSSSRKRSSSSRGGREMVISSTGLDSLPDDILTQILIRIPAQDVVYSIKFVCRKWREITRTLDFADAHFHHSTPGLLVQNHDHLKMATFMSLAPEGSNQIQISDFIHTSEDGYFWTSCNGLTLEPKFNDGDELMITNPVTRQHFYLPPFMAPTIEYNNMRSAIAYVATRNEYKVVRSYYPPYADQSGVHCAILTVGVDKSWRLVDTQHLSLQASFKLIYCTLVTEGFVHWVDNGNDYDNKRILSLNMETEVITQIFAPQCTDRYYDHDYTYLSAGSSLSLLISIGRLKWEVWEMKPLESGEYSWTKLPDIDLEAHRALLNEWCCKEVNGPLFKPGDKFADRLDCCVRPSGWLKYREVIVFYAFQRLSSCKFHVVYDVQTKDVSLYKADRCSYPHVVHRNSLVWIC